MENSQSTINSQRSTVNDQHRIVFFGSPNFTEAIKNCLKDNFELVLSIEKPRDWTFEEMSKLKELCADFFVVANFGQILPGELLQIPRFASVNIHPSLLPKYRGPSPIQTAILIGDKKTGVSIIKMDEKMDHGPILKQTEEPILSSDTFESLAHRLFEKSAEMLEYVIIGYNDIRSADQDESKASYTKLLTRDDGFLNQETLEIGNLKLEIERAVLAYYPWPSVWTKFNLNDKEVIIKLLPQNQIQVEGKKPMSFKDFKNGYEKGSELIEKLGLQA